MFGKSKYKYKKGSKKEMERDVMRTVLDWYMEQSDEMREIVSQLDDEWKEALATVLADISTLVHAAAKSWLVK